MSIACKWTLNLGIWTKKTTEKAWKIENIKLRNIERAPPEHITNQQSFAVGQPAKLLKDQKQHLIECNLQRTQERQSSHVAEMPQLLNFRAP